MPVLAPVGNQMCGDEAYQGPDQALDLEVVSTDPWKCNYGYGERLSLSWETVA